MTREVVGGAVPVWTRLLVVVFLFHGSSCKSPVIFVPGDGGNQIEARLNKSAVVHYLCEKRTADYFNIWLNRELLVPLVVDCWVDNMRLRYDNASRSTRDADGVSVRVPGWGASDTCEWIDPSRAAVGAYFNAIAERLVAAGHYERDASVRCAPYDFRRAPNENQEYFIRLKSLVESTYTTNNNSRVSLVAHSMGGLMSLYFLQQQTMAWKDKYIQRLVTISTPWGGAVKALKVFAMGDDLGSFALWESVLREEQITSPSLAWLLPSPLFWKETEVLIETQKYNYTMKDLKNFFFDINYMTGWEMRKDTLKYTMDFTPPGVELHCLYSKNVPTVEKLYYKPGTWLDGKPTLINGDGDGTVNLRSLEGCLYWSTYKKAFRKHRQYKMTKHMEVDNVDHLGILSDKRILAYIGDLFSE